MQSVEFVNGKLVNVAEWYLKSNGHDLEENLKIAFPELRKYNKGNELKQEIIQKVLDDIPGFIPKDFLELFKSLQE